MAQIRVAVHWLLTAALVLTALVLVTGCDSCVGVFTEPQPDLTNPKTYRAGRVEVSYPGNWSATHDTATEAGTSVSTVTLESKGSSIAMVQTFEPAIAIDTNTYLVEVLAATQKEAQDMAGGLLKASSGSNTPLTGTLLGKPADGHRATLTLTVLGEKVPTEVTIQRVVLTNATVVVMTMTPTEDQTKAEPAFQHIKASLKVSPKP